ncbi:helix-turn-helix domain-containing protein [Mucilaginibacter aquaedulcis]|uniref:helix-turn-helix domain-containing protein n=1 Tax=Mucilaginibacter aquaedulcis TaxID=1187081 RepID=UPI0025B5CCCB|nr:helix-turn-helix transcriptional regulator [Mucilaginibacter aquaedulcis]MDN3547451.1 helix-turn-helix transcriptional regulator [Mucilaginibacter aquaedulcis]
MEQKPISIDQFYQQVAALSNEEVTSLLPAGINQEIGHFNVFDVGEMIRQVNMNPNKMPYNRRAYYKISLVRGRNIAEYADKVFQIDQNALVFATPKIPYHWLPQDMDQSGNFCIFTDEFLIQSKSGVVLDELPIFKPGGYPVFLLTNEQAEEIAPIFRKMHAEIASNYLYKYDLIRNYVLELVHYGQKLQPLTTYNITHNASARVSSLFIELLERQFPVASTQQKVGLRTAKDFADRLAIHSNHLNKVLKESTGKTTTEHISSRLVQEAKILLKQTDWNISEIAYSLGFEQLSHFSTFFKKQTSMSPMEIRSQAV